MLYDLALTEFSLALNQGFKPLEIYRVRSYIFLEQKNYEAAISDIQKGLALVPKDLNFLKALGSAHLERNEFPAALDAFRRAILLAPKDGDLYYNIARVQLAMGDSKAQAAAADAALKNGTQFVGEAYYLLGDANQKQKNIAGAIDAFQKAISAKPDSYSVYRSLADIFRSENRFADAITVLTGL